MQINYPKLLLVVLVSRCTTVAVFSLICDGILFSGDNGDLNLDIGVCNELTNSL